MKKKRRKGGNWKRSRKQGRRRTKKRSVDLVGIVGDVANLLEVSGDGAVEPDEDGGGHDGGDD